MFRLGVARDNRYTQDACAPERDPSCGVEVFRAAEYRCFHSGGGNNLWQLSQGVGPGNACVCVSSRQVSGVPFSPLFVFMNASLV